jgi:hypothetical protein
MSAPVTSRATIQAHIVEWLRQLRAGDYAPPADFVFANAHARVDDVRWLRHA